MKFNKTQQIAYTALLIALEVVLGRFAGIMTPIVSINFSFLPLVINAIVFGPVSAACSAAIADVLGAFLFPQGLGIYFPGFTLSAALNGLAYGLLLHRKPKKLWRISLVCLITNILISLGLSTYWVYMMTGKGFLILLPPRILQNVILMPIKFFVIWIIVYRVIPFALKGAILEPEKAKETTEI